MVAELVTGGIGFLAGVLFGKIGAPAPIPQYLTDIAKNLEVIVVVGETRLPLILKPLYGYERPYRWGPEGNPVYTRIDGVFAFVAPAFSNDFWQTEGDIEAFADIMDWGNPDINYYVIDFGRNTWDKVEVYYKGDLILTFPAEPTPNTPLSGFAVIQIDINTLNLTTQPLPLHK